MEMASTIPPQSHSPALNAVIVNQNVDNGKTLSKNAGVIQLAEKEPHSGNVTESPLMKGMTFLHCFVLYFSAMNGLGIFVTPSLVAASAPNMCLAIIAWLLAGICALLGAFCYSEIVSVVKKTGGSYIFVRACYGEAMGFLIIWIYAIFLIPFDTGFAVFTVGYYACAPFFEDHSKIMYIWVSKCIGLIVFYVAVVVSLLGFRVAAKVMYIVTLLKIVLLIVLIGVGSYYSRVTKNVSNLSADIMFNNTWSSLQENPIALKDAFFNAYMSAGGWGSIAIFVEELRNPKRNIPLVSISAIGLLTIIHILITIIMLTVLSQQEMAASAMVFSTFLIKGADASFRFITPLFVIGCGFAGFLALLYHYPRFLLSAAREGQFPSILCLISSKRRTPVIAILYMGVTATVITLAGEKIVKLVEYGNVVTWIQCGITFSTVIAFRRKMPSAVRSYRVWITTPIFMLLISAIVVVASVWEFPSETSLVILGVTLGFPVYYIFIFKKWFSFLLPVNRIERLSQRAGLVRCSVSDS